MESVAHVVKHMATKDDIAGIRGDMATKDQVIALQTQVNGIEADIRSMKQSRLEVRVADLEESLWRIPLLTVTRER